jgi:hypothetical protein
LRRILHNPSEFCPLGSTKRLDLCKKMNIGFRQQDLMLVFHALMILKHLRKFRKVTQRKRVEKKIRRRGQPFTFFVELDETFIYSCSLKIFSSNTNSYFLFI